jgi:hypothetical protein
MRRANVSAMHKARLFASSLFSAGEVFVDGFGEQREPPFEMCLLHWKNGVLHKWRALIITTPE